MNPIDATHADSIEAVRQIRARIRLLRHHVAVWRPRPMPEASR